MQLDSDRTALVVVDMQNGFCHPDGSLYAPASEEAIEGVATILERARAADVQVVFTQDVHPPDQFENTMHYDEFERWGEHVLEGSWEADIVDELSVTVDDHLVEKHTYDAFHRTDLHGWLRAHNLDTLLFCGTLANVCVLHTAGSAGLLDYRPILVRDAIGAISDDDKSYALDHADWLFGDVIDREDIRFEDQAHE